MINKLSTSHAGTQPIRVLQHNITKQFEDTTPDFIQLTLDTIINKGLKLGIGYFVNEEPIRATVGGHSQTPYVDSNKKIHIHETFLSYVWCISYSLIVLYDEAVAKPSQNAFLGVEQNKIDLQKIANAQELFNYGISLITSFSKWDKENLPNPEYYKEDDQFYIERVNGIYVYAMNFILCHEFIHVEREHIDQLIKGATSNSDILNFEREADKKAIELILSGVSEEKRKTAIGGILVGLCCLLYFKNETLSHQHPDTDKRIDNFLIVVTAENDDPVWGIAALAYKLWDNQFSKSYNYPAQVADFKEMYLWIKALVEEENKVARTRIK
jgi:hypothetical protein